jgi:glyoxylase-like metal-dependent hydrolase (beta-lactamase superfamily II)
MPAGSHRFQVGAITCSALTDGYASYPTAWIFPEVDGDRLTSALERRGLPQDCVLSPHTCLLIETGRRIILVDAGGGDSAATSGAIAGRLEMAGVRCKDVDTVILTHAHPDHIAGAIDARGHPTFPNAAYLISELEQEFWMTSRIDLGGMRVPDDIKNAIQRTARRVLAALHFQIELIERETEITPGVRLIPAPGHTPGHLATLITSEGQHLLNLGDAAAHPLHLEEPEWQNGFDLSASRAAQTRRTLLARAAAENMHVMGFHFPFPSVGRIAERGAAAWTWLPGW